MMRGKGQIECNKFQWNTHNMQNSLKLTLICIRLQFQQLIKTVQIRKCF